MVSTRPIAAIATMLCILSLLFPAVGLADQSCPDKSQITFDGARWNVVGSGWKQSNDYMNAKAIHDHIAVTTKWNQPSNTYKVSCIYRANGGGSSYLILEKHFNGQPQLGGNWKKHICLAAQKVSCDYHCEASQGCSW